MNSPAFVRSRWLAVAWALAVALVLGHVGWLWGTHRLSPDTDILAMLPGEERDPVLQQAIEKMAHASQQRLVVLVGARDWDRARQAADAYRAVLLQHGDQFRLSDNITGAAQQGWLDQFWPHRMALLTAAQRQALAGQPPHFWIEAAQRQLYSPLGGIKVGAWQDDPFGLFAGWTQARAQESVVRPSDGRLRVDAGDLHYVLLPVELTQPSFSLAAQQRVMPLLEQAQQAARQAVPQAQIKSAGLILHAAAAGKQANAEMSTIGWGSMIGILVLMWLLFRSLLPITLVVLSLGIGCVGALSICWLLYGRVDLLTLVFGASLIGVAEDYGIHYFCDRLEGQASVSPLDTMRRLLPGLTLALVTTVVAYLALALTPFPGLRQMAVFSSVGLCFAWLTVVCWFPVLDRMPPRKSKLLDWYGRSRRVWPRLGRNSVSAVVVALTLVFCVIGVARLRTNDDIRLLQNSPQALIDEQLQVSKLLAAPGLAQFYLVRGATPEQVLQREEALKSRLDAMVAAGSLSGYQALSNWVPSQRTQTDNRALITHALLTSDGPLRKLATELDESRQWTQQVRARLAGADAGAAPLTLPAFLQSPASEPWRHLWLGKVDGGYASMVALRGVDARNLASLDATAHGLPGVQWVDKVGRISSLLGRYRQHMGLVVLGSYAMVFLLLYWRYRGQAWRALMPTLVASTLTLAVFGMTGQAINLFHVLALLLTLGMGVDYGILLQEHPDRQDKHAWMAVSMSAASTLLAFGLLGLSKTPALHAFGLTMLLAVGGACLIAPCFGSGNSNQEE